MIEENVQVGSGVSGAEEEAKPKRISTSPKTTRETWDKVRREYELGTFKSIRELGERYGIHHESLKTRAMRERWKEKRELLLTELNETIQKEMVSETEEWLKRVKARGRKDWEIVDKSVDGLGGEVDPDSMSGYMRSRKIIDDMVRRSLGLRDEMDVTSGGKPIGESLVSALKSLREQKDIPTITSEDVSTIIHAEIVD